MRGDGPHGTGEGAIGFIVFPACAGMDRPRRRSALPLWPCSPRARGWTDAPRAHREGAGGVPRVRGDGPALLSCTGTAFYVFPACAGMDRRRSRHDDHRRPCSPRARGWTGRRGAHAVAVGRVPRVRGDGPTQEVAETRRALVFPACAGMDRSRARRSDARIRVPRVRGDGPARTCCRRCGWWCSPRARGWTDRRHHPHHCGQVFPACAGMDRTFKHFLG